MTYTNNTNSSNSTSNPLLENDMHDFAKVIHSTTNDLNKTSKEILDKKISIIEKAQDMTTDEKITALNKSYERHQQEKYTNLFVAISSTLVMAIVIAMLPTSSSKSTRRLAISH